MPEDVQELRSLLEQLTQRLAQLDKEIGTLRLGRATEQDLRAPSDATSAPVPVQTPQPTPFSQIAAEELGGTQEEFQQPGPPGRPVTTSGRDRDVAEFQLSHPILGLANRGAERIGGGVAEGVLKGVGALIPGEDPVERAGAAVSERRDIRSTAREEMAPSVPVWKQVVGSLADVGLDIGLLGRTPGLGKALLGTSRAQAVGRGAVPAIKRLAQTTGAEIARGGAVETGLSIMEGDVGAEGARRQQIGAGFGAALGPVIGVGSEVMRLRGRLNKARMQLSEVNTEIDRLRGIGSRQRAGQAQRARDVDLNAAQRGVSEVESSRLAQGPIAEETQALERTRRAVDRLMPTGAPSSTAEEFAARAKPGTPGLGSRGAALSPIIEPIAGAGVGATAGGIQGGRDSDGNLWRDIAIGGLAGLGIAAGGRSIVGKISRRRAAIRNAKLPEQSRRIQAHIGTGAQESSLPTVGELYRRLFRSQKAVETVERTLSGGRVVRSMDSPTVAAELSSGSARRAEGALTIGVPKWTPEGDIAIVGESFEEILAPLKGQLDDFQRYEVAARTLEVGQRSKLPPRVVGKRTVPRKDIETGISLDDARFEVENASPAVIEAHKKAVMFRRGILEYWRDAGGISQDAFDAMIELGAHYVPLNRIFAGRDPVLGASRIGKVVQDVRALGGSKRRLVGSVESTIDQTNRLIRNADQNKVSLRLIELAEANPGNARGLIERAEDPVARIASGKSKLLQEAAAARGVTLSDETATELTAGLADLTKREHGTLTVADDILRVWRNGKQEHWRLAPDLARGIRGMSPNKLEWWVRLMGAPASGLKTGVTLHPAFQAVNFVRDTLTAAIQSQYKKTLGSRAVGAAIGGGTGATIAPEGKKVEGAVLGGLVGASTGMESFRGLYESVKGTWLGKASKNYNDFVLGGGGFSSYRGSRSQTLRQQQRAITPQSVGRRLADRTAGAAVGATAGAATGDEGDRIKRAAIGATVGFATGVTHPLEALKQVAAPFEEAARMGEFLRARESGRNVMESVIASKKVSVDFQQMGASMGAFSHMAAFLNPAVQSLDTMMRIAARPVTKAVGARRGGASAGATAKVVGGEAARVYGTAIGAIAIPSMLLWAANRDDQQINDLRKTASGTIYWFYRKSNGEIGKIPKPFVWGQIFGTGVESALDAFLEQDPDAAQRFVEGVREQSVFQVLPTIAQITRDQWKNEDGFFKTPIVPPGLEGQVEPRFQSRPSTGIVARMIGDRYNISPARIESIWQDISGTLGKDALKLFDRAVEKLTNVEDTGMPTLPSDNVLWGRFTARYPTTAVEPVQTFYKNQREVAVFANSLALVEKTDPRRAMEMLQGHQEDFALIPLYEAARQKIAEIRADMEFIRQQPVSVMPKAEKQRLIDSMNVGIIETTRNVNNLVSRFKLGREDR